MHSLGPFRKSLRISGKILQLSQTVSESVGGGWFENDQKCSYVAAQRARCKGGQTNFGLSGGSLTDVSSDHTGSLLTQTLPLFLQVCPNTSILSRILAGITEIAKVDFQIFHKALFCRSTTWNYAASESWAIYNKSRR